MLGVPFLQSNAFHAHATDADTVTSASLILDAPSGEYVVFLNRARHPDPAALSHWEDFFAGKDVPVIYEDISCIAIEGDLGGIEMATSLQSRLPEHQMTLRTEEGALLMSKAERGLYDVVVLSKEAADAYDVSALSADENAIVVRIAEDGP